jgi:hypothetical protein
MKPSTDTTLCITTVLITSPGCSADGTGPAALCRQHVHGLLDHVEEGEAGLLGQSPPEDMRGVTGNRDQRGSEQTQVVRPFEHREVGLEGSPQHRADPIRNRRIGPDNDSQVILITCRGCPADEFGVEVRGRGRPHSAENPDQRAAGLAAQPHIGRPRIGRLCAGQRRTAPWSRDDAASAAAAGASPAKAER